MSLSVADKRTIEANKFMSTYSIARKYNLDIDEVENYLQDLKKSKEKRTRAVCPITGFPYDNRWR